MSVSQYSILLSLESTHDSGLLLLFSSKAYWALCADRRMGLVYSSMTSPLLPGNWPYCYFNHMTSIQSGNHSSSSQFPTSIDRFGNGFMTHLDQTKCYPQSFLTGAQRGLSPSLGVKLRDVGLRAVEDRLSSQVEVGLRKYSQESRIRVEKKDEECHGDGPPDSPCLKASLRQAADWKGERVNPPLA